MTNQVTKYMQQALALAERGRFTVSPNPMVGSVIVKNNEIIGTGFHERAGTPHAEVHALREAGSSAEGGTLYVTLEPCCHFGRTPPCTDAIIAAKVKKVVVACHDPNPLVASKGIEKLKQAGIEVEFGLLEQEAKKLNEIFFHFITTKRPFVIAKWAMSLDGKTITHGNDSKQISGAAAFEHTHQLRQTVDAILVGANTAIHDDPALNVRLPDAKKQPTRIIVTSDGKLPLDLQVLNPSESKTIVATTDLISKETIENLSNKGVQVLMIKRNQHNQVHLPNLLDELGKLNMTSMLVEGGMTILEDFFREKLINKTHIYIAPVIIGKEPKKQFIPNMKVETLGQDILMTAQQEDLIYV